MFDKMSKKTIKIFVQVSTVSEALSENFKNLKVRDISELSDIDLNLTTANGGRIRRMD